MQGKTVRRLMAQAMAATMIFSNVAYVSAEEPVEAESNEESYDEIYEEPSEEVNEESSADYDLTVVENVDNDVEGIPAWPAVRTYPDGSAIDLGGMEIIVRDWFSYDFTEFQIGAEDVAKKQYVEWLSETYNFKITQDGMSQWADVGSDFVEYQTGGGDSNNYVFVLRDEPNVVSAMNIGLMYDFSKCTALDFTKEKYALNGIDKVYRKGDSVYAMDGTGAHPDTATVLVYNKRILQESGIDPEAPYDMQKNGTWTWDAWTQMMDTVQKHYRTAGGTYTVMGFDGQPGSLALAAANSNGVNYVDCVNGRMVSNFNSNEHLYSLTWTLDILNKYQLDEPYDADWDYYKQAFIDGEYAFLVESAYVVTSGNWCGGSSEDLGVVSFPKGPNGKQYANTEFGNLAVIPACYGDERANKIALAYDLFTDFYEWYGMAYSTLGDNLCPNIDSRTITETIPGLCKNVMYPYDIAFNLNINESFRWNINRNATLESLTSNFAQFDAVIAGSTQYRGTFGSSDGLRWVYDMNAQTLTISGSDTVNESIKNVLGNIKIECVYFENCTLTKSISNMFSGCSYLKKVDFSGANFVEVSDMNNTFSNCASLTAVDFGSMEIASGTNVSDMFWDTYNIRFINTPQKIADDIFIGVNNLYVDGNGSFHSFLDKAAAGKSLIGLIVQSEGMSMNVMTDGTLVAYFRFSIQNDVFKYQDMLSVKYGKSGEPYEEVSLRNMKPIGQSEQSTMYEVTIPLAAKDLGDQLGVCLAGGEGHGTIVGINVGAYLNTFVRDKRYSEYSDFAKALLNYGAAAQLYFKYTDEYFEKYPYAKDYYMYDLANSYLDDVDRIVKPLTDKELSAYAASPKDVVNGPEYIGTSLVLDSTISIRHYYSPGKLGSYNIGGAVTDVNYEKSYIEISNLTLFDINKGYKVNISNKSNTSQTCSYSYGIGNYIYAAYHQPNHDQKLMDLLTCLYRVGEEMNKL
ncbi:MAG: hypothetical protein MJ104_01310 [Lachnospiraceae bacterium]|nr:hypothetical protein [Lachnospiraceae bacterium]